VAAAVIEMANEKISLRARKKFIRPLSGLNTKDPISEKTLNVMQASRNLSDQNKIPATGTDTGAIEGSLAVLGAFGISVVEETEDVSTSILTGNYLDKNKVEQFLKTNDDNPNREQIKKFQQLKSKKISFSKVFNQDTINPINELDTCQPDELKSQTKQLSNVIEITNDFINLSTISLTKRMSLK
jgi:hypothetical protein